MLYWRDRDNKKHQLDENSIPGKALLGFLSMAPWNMNEKRTRDKNALDLLHKFSDGVCPMNNRLLLAYSHPISSIIGAENARLILMDEEGLAREHIESGKRRNLLAEMDIMDDFASAYLWSLFFDIKDNLRSGPGPRLSVAAHSYGVNYFEYFMQRFIQEVPEIAGKMSQIFVLEMGGQLTDATKRDLPYKVMRIIGMEDTSAAIDTIGDWQRSGLMEEKRVITLDTSMPVRVNPHRKLESNPHSLVAYIEAIRQHPYLFKIITDAIKAGQLDKDPGQEAYEEWKRNSEVGGPPGTMPSAERRTWVKRSSDRSNRKR